jgi:chemotaxis protein MotB
MLRKGSGRKGKGVAEERTFVKKVRFKYRSAPSGAWKVAYADFVTSMMALFIVLWIVAAGDHELKAGVARYFRDPGVFDSSRGLIPVKDQGVQSISTSGEEALKGLQEGLEEDLHQLKEYASVAGQISIRLTPEGLLIEMIDTDRQAFFDLSSAELKPILRRVLEVIVQRVKYLPNAVAISGHTDSRQYHNAAFYSNWELSSARALNARRAMEEMQLPPARVERVVGYADRFPLSADHPLDPSNRRISVLVLKEGDTVKTAALKSESNKIVTAQVSMH